MKEIFAHEYTLRPMQRMQNGLGILSIRVEIVTDSREPEPMIAEQAIKFFDQNLRLEHKILLEGFLNE